MAGQRFLGRSKRSKSGPYSSPHSAGPWKTKHVTSDMKPACVCMENRGMALFDADAKSGLLKPYRLSSRVMNRRRNHNTQQSVTGKVTVYPEHPATSSLQACHVSFTSTTCHALYADGWNRSASNAYICVRKYSVSTKPACLDWAVCLACGDAGCSFLSETLKVTVVEPQQVKTDCSTTATQRDTDRQIFGIRQV